MRPTRTTLALLAATLTAAPAGAAAQQRPGAEPPDTLAADTFRIRELVVTATRTPMPASAVPAAVTVFTGAELRARGVKHVADALREVPGATVVQTGPYGGTASLFLRGGESDYVKVLVDGVEVNQPGGGIDLSTLTTDDVARIEVVRGPVSVLYGSDAVSGVVQIFTRDGAGPAALSVRARGGSFGTREAGATIAGGDRRVGYSASLSRFASDGTWAYNNQYRNDVAAGRLRLRLDDRTEAHLTLRRSDSEYHYPTDGAGNLVDRNQFQTGVRTTLSLDLSRRLASWLDARLLLGSSGLASALDDAPDGPADTLGAFAYHGSGDATRRSAELRATGHLGVASLTLGGVVERQHERQRGDARTQWGDFPSDYGGTRTDRGYYAQLVARPGSGLTLTAGARLDDDDAFGRFATWRGGVSWRVLPGTRVRVAIGTAFKEPTMLENFGVGFARGNPALRPERSGSAELGIDQDLAGGRLRLGATWFDQRFRDMIDYDAAPPGADAPNYYNIAGARARGLELTGRVVVTPALALVADYTHLDAATTDTSFVSGPDALFAPGAPLLRRPADAARVGLALALPAGATASLDIARTGARWDLDYADYPAKRVRLAPHTRVDAAASTPIPLGRGPGVVASLRVENLLNAGYQEVAHFPARGRTILAGLEVRLGR